MNGAPERPSFRRILVGLDASRQSLEALEAAALLAAELSAELTGLFVEDAGLLDIAALPGSRAHGAAGELDRAMMERALRIQARRARQAMAGIAERSRVQWSFRVTRGDIGRELLAAAAECDLVTLGLTSAASVGRARVGRTARSTAAAAGCAVLLYPPGQRAMQPIAALADGDPRVLETAAWLAERHGGRLLVLLDEPDAGKAKRLAATVERQLSDRPLKVRLHQLGKADIEEALRRAGFDYRGLLVMGRRHSLFRADLPQRLLEHLHCALLLL
ncbi:MAG: universal stress protein [Kiloniellales bacterium]